jgi:hypothetical protein
MQIISALQANLFVVEHMVTIEANPLKGQKQEIYLTREVLEAKKIPKLLLQEFYNVNNSNLP